MTRRACAAALSVFLSGCALIDQLSDDTSPIVADIEVFNRTTSDIFYIAADGKRLDVPACGSASDPTFRIDAVRVRTEEGYIRGFGYGRPELAERRLFVVEVARARDSGIPQPGPPPEPLPPCDEPPEVQAGV